MNKYLTVDLCNKNEIITFHYSITSDLLYRIEFYVNQPEVLHLIRVNTIDLYMNFLILKSMVTWR